MVIGFLPGAIIALMVFLYKTEPEIKNPYHTTNKPSSAQVDNTHKATEPGQENTGKKPAASDEVEYTFFTELPKREVLISEQELAKELRGKIRPPPPDPKVKEPETKTPTPGKIYILQAGSFKRQAQAESHKARLALLGVVSQIETISLKSELWYRVRIGPFENYDEIQENLDRLRKHDISAIVVKLK